MKKIGLRIFGKGVEGKNGPERKVTDISGKDIWIQSCKCPHCDEEFTIYKWIDEWKEIVIS